MPSFLSWGTTPHRSDTINTLLKRIALSITGGGGGGASQQVYNSEGDPNGVVLHNSTSPAMCIDTVNHITWTKTDGIASNTGWGSP